MKAFPFALALPLDVSVSVDAETKAIAIPSATKEIYSTVVPFNPFAWPSKRPQASLSTQPQSAVSLSARKVPARSICPMAFGVRRGALLLSFSQT